LAFRPHHLRPGTGKPGSLTFRLKVISTEVTGSESFIHTLFGDNRWVMLTHGIQIHPPGAELDAFVEPEDVMAFDAEGRALDYGLRRAA
jgi:glycerol transport system ATP-binding protein